MGDQHLKALRSPRVSRQDRRRVPNARALAGFAVAHTRLANSDRADAGHDLAFRKMAVAHDALLARLRLEIGVLCEKLSDLRFDGLGQQRTRAAAQDLCQGIGKGPWLGELDDVTVRHGVSLLHWRSGGVEHHHDTPPYPVTPSPTSGHSSPCERNGSTRIGSDFLLHSVTRSPCAVTIRGCARRMLSSWRGWRQPWLGPRIIFTIWVVDTF